MIVKLRMYTKLKQTYTQYSDRSNLTQKRATTAETKATKKEAPPNVEAALPAVGVVVVVVPAPGVVGVVPPAAGVVAPPAPTTLMESF